MKPTLLIALVISLAGCVRQADPVIRFEDPAVRGSLMIYDHPSVPARFHGLWADRLTTCGAAGDRGVQVEIEEHTIGTAPVMQVEGYSDYEAVVVTVDDPDLGRERIFLEPSEDGQWLNLSEGFGSEVQLLRRCPSISRR